FVLAQEVPAKPASPPPNNVPSTESSPRDLRDGELAISGRYARFERMLSQMADVLGRQDPERADLLRRAIGKGREDQVKENIEKTIELLSKGELGTATEKQQDVVSSLESLLKLLQSEDRRSSVERERERLNELLKDVRGVLAEQKSARAATQNSEAPSNAAPGQQRALSETEKLLESMKEHDDQEAKPDEQGDASETETESSENKEGKSKEGKSKEGDASKDAKDPKQSKESLEGKSEKSSEDPETPESKEGKSTDGKSEQGKGKKSEKQGTPSEGKDKSEKKSGQKSGQQKSEQKEARQTPGREQLENAEEQMEKALENLKEQEREKALENEDAAIEELHEAAARLEETLKQLREEEKEMLLASLEARLQRMLVAETQIREGTITLAATPQKDWLDQYYGRCQELAQQQSELTLQCSQTVSLLREDGTSVAILLAVEDVEADMGSVSGWLQESKVGELTQSVQSDIIESLKQLIETTQKEMQEMKEEQQQQQQQQSSEQKQGLVELMAEIRMLRNLQLQVNRRTKQVDGLLQKAATDDLPALQKQVHELSLRQHRLTQSARELAKQAK
ncbi:MAG: hypothetical protein DWH78_03955, partial [Planctomycetota bacterium]